MICSKEVKKVTNIVHNGGHLAIKPVIIIIIITIIIIIITIIRIRIRIRNDELKRVIVRMSNVRTVQV